MKSYRNNKKDGGVDQFDILILVTPFLLHSLQDVRYSALSIFKDFFRALIKKGNPSNHVGENILIFFGKSKLIQFCLK